MNNKILIIGSHPIISDMTRQYSQRGDEVIHYVDDEGIDATDLTAIREIVLLPDINKPSMEADNETMRLLREWLPSMPPSVKTRSACYVICC